MTNNSRTKILSAQKIPAKLPLNLLEGDEELFTEAMDKELPDVFIYSFKNVNISPAGIVFKGLRVFKQFLIWPKHVELFNSLYLLRNYLTRKKQVVDVNVIVCFDYWSMGYFHWICDFLPRLMLFERELDQTAVLLPENHSSPFIQQSLEAFGIRTIIRFPDSAYVKCKHALIPGHVTKSGDHRPEIMLSLRDKLMKFYPPDSDKAYPKNIYISRSRSFARFILNEAEVIRVLETYDFKTIYFEEHSFSEQIAIAYHAQNLIGLHGANLTNIIFMKPGSNILEFRRKKDPDNNYYLLLASTFDVNYNYLTCDFKENDHEQRFDVTVDIDALVDNLNRLTSNQAEHTRKP
jgi:capsular polysaccharide biosynthesis protein